MLALLMQLQLEILFLRTYGPYLDVITHERIKNQFYSSGWVDVIP